MGYRMYLATMDKSIVEEMRKKDNKSFTEDYLNGNEDTYFPVYKFPTHQEVFELGKYIDEEIREGVTGKTPPPFFEDEEIQSVYMTEQELYFVGKQGLLALIEEYRKKVIVSYESLIGEPDLNDRVTLGENAKEKKVEQFLQGRLYCWNNPYLDYLNFNEDSPKLHHFWDYEYLIFSLLHLLKTIDWDKKELILYAY